MMTDDWVAFGHDDLTETTIETLRHIKEMCGTFGGGIATSGHFDDDGRFIGGFTWVQLSAGIEIGIEISATYDGPPELEVTLARRASIPAEDRRYYGKSGLSLRKLGASVDEGTPWFEMVEHAQEMALELARIRDETAPETVADAIVGLYAAECPTKQDVLELLADHGIGPTPPTEGTNDD